MIFGHFKKPKNLLLNSNCQLKICDFGSAKTVLPELKLISNRFTDYVVTRWYRAPELLLSWKKYTSAGKILYKNSISNGD